MAHANADELVVGEFEYEDMLLRWYNYNGQAFIQRFDEERGRWRDWGWCQHAEFEDIRVDYDDSEWLVGIDNDGIEFYSDSAGKNWWNRKY